MTDPAPTGETPHDDLGPLPTREQLAGARGDALTLATAALETLLTADPGVELQARLITREILVDALDADPHTSAAHLAALLEMLGRIAAGCIAVLAEATDADARTVLRRTALHVATLAHDDDGTAGSPDP